MSNTRKLNILHELDVAIKRKTLLQKPNLTKTPINLMSSIQKRRPSHKSVANKNKSQDKPMPVRDKSPPRRQASIIKQQIFNNENLKALELSDKKFHNKRMDKLISLINYVLSSAEKVVKHVNITNFEAEFAVKLFRSDKETLLSELDGFNVEEIVLATSQRSGAKSQAPQNNNLNFENHSLKSENMSLKKELMLLEAECSRLKDEKISLNSQLKSMKHNSFIGEDKKSNKLKDQEISNLIREISDLDDSKRQDKAKEHQLKHHLFLKQREIEKLSAVLRQLIDKQITDVLVENLDKSTKFNMIVFNNPENERKKVELEALMANLDKEFQLGVKEIVEEFGEKEQVIRMLIERVPEVLDRELEGANFEEIRLVELLEMLLTVFEKKEKEMEQSKGRDNDLEQTVINLKQQLTALSKQNQELQKQKDKDKDIKKESSSIAANLIKERDTLQENLEKMSNRLKELCINAEISVVEVGKMGLGEMIEELQAVIVKRKKAKSKEINELMVQNDKLKDTLNKLEQDNTVAKKHNQQEIKQLKIQVTNLSEENKQLHKNKIQLFELRGTLEEHKVEVEELRSVIRKMEAQLDENEKVLELNKKLNIDNLKLQKFKDDYTQQQKGMKKLEDRLEKERKEKASLQNQVDDIKQHNQELQKQLEQQSGQLNNEIQEIKSNLSQAQKKFKDNTKQLQAIIKQQRDNLQKEAIETAGLRNYITQLCETLKAKDNQRGESDKELWQKQQQILKLQEQIRTLKHEDDQSQQKLSGELSQLYEKYEEEKKECNRFQTKVNELEIEIKVYQVKLSEKNAKIEDLQNTILKNEEQLKQVEELENSLQNAKQEVLVVNEQMGVYKSMKDEIEEARDQLVVENGRLVSENSTIKQESLKYRDEIVNLKEINNGLQKEKEQLQVKIYQTESSIQELKDSNREKTEMIEELKQRSQNANQFSTELHRKNQAIEELMRKIQEDGKVQQQLKEEIKMFKGVIEQKQEDVVDKGQQIQHLKEKSKEQQTLIARSQNNVLELEHHNSALKQLVTQLEQNLKELASNFSEINLSHAALKQQCQQYKNRLLRKQKQSSVQHYNNDQLNQLKETLISKQEEFKELQTKVQSLFTTNTTLLVQNERIHKEMERSEEKIRMMENEMNEVGKEWELKDRLANEKNTQLVKRLEEKEQRVKEVEENVRKLEESVKVLENEILNIQKVSFEKQQQERKAMSEEKDKLNRIIENLTEQNKARTAQFKQLNEQIAESKLHSTSLTTQIQQLTIKHSTQLKQLQNKSVQLSSSEPLKVKIQELEQQLENQKEQKEEIQQQRKEEAKMVIELNEKLREQMEKSEKQIVRLESQISGLNSTIDENKAKIEELENESKMQLVRNSNEFNIKIHSLQTKKEELQETIKAQRSQLEEMNIAKQELKQQTNILQQQNDQLIKTVNQKQILLDTQQQSIDLLQQKLALSVQSEQSITSYKQQCQFLKKKQIQTEESYKIAEMAQQHRMNLIKLIVKKITDVDDIEPEDVDNLLAEAIRIVVGWKNSQPKFDSATPKKFITSEEQLTKGDRQISLSGFCEEGISEMSGSIIDRLGNDSVPELNFEKINSNSNNEEKREVVEPITSIQNRLQHFESGELQGLIKTQETVSEKNAAEEVSGVEELKRGTEIREESENEDQDKEVEVDRQEVDNEQKQKQVENLDEVIHYDFVESSDEEEQQETKEIVTARQNEPQPVQQQLILEQKSPQQKNINQQDHTNKQVLTNTIEQAPSQTLQKPITVQDESLNQFSDFKDAGNSSQLDHSNIIESSKIDPEQQSNTQVLNLVNSGVQTVLEQKTEKKEAQQHKQEQKQQQKQEQYPAAAQQPKELPKQQSNQNQFDDFKDMNDTSQLDRSNLGIQDNPIAQENPIHPHQSSKHSQLGSEELPDAVDTSLINKSILSDLNKEQKPEEVNEMEFPDVQDTEELDKSLVQSNLPIQNQEEVEKPQEVSASEFENYEEPSLSESMVSDKHTGLKQQNQQPHNLILPKSDLPQPTSQQHEASLGDFGDVQPSQDLSKSAIYQQQTQKQELPHQDQQHGFNDFGSVHQSMSQSLIEEHPEGEDKNNAGNEFEDFGNELGNALDSSIMSDKMVDQQGEGEHHGELEGFIGFLEENGMRSSVIVKKEEQ